MAGLMAVLAAGGVRGDPKTVCTITVNSPDEKEVLQRSLPRDEYRFVELVERGRPDWLASSCRAGIHCDVLVISGHFDGGTEFYTDRLEQREFLPVDEMERVSCSDSCPGLFSQLKEVYLFGCKTLNAEAQRSASAEIVRALVRSGHSPAEAERIARMLGERYGESNRDRMRHIFKDVPVIYGFSSKAPLGPIAASTLNRYFQSDANRDFGSGRTNPRFLALFAPSSMTVAAGLTEADPHAGFHRDACHFSDDRLSAAQKLRFVHELLHREMAEVRMFLDAIEKYSTSLSERERQAPEVSAELVQIAVDRLARERFIEFARDADDPAVRSRMLALARTFGWLTEAEQHAEYVRMIGDQLRGRSVGAADVELVCSLNRHHELDSELPRLQAASIDAKDVARSAIVACLGGVEGHARMLRALTSASDEDVQIAQVYLRHHPIADARELRSVTSRIARMTGTDAQTRALETLARYRLSDRESLEELTGLFPRARSVGVQRAIAGILIRSNYEAIASPALVTALRHHRLKSPDGKDVIDVLIRRMETAL
jgi:hypothetical protein